MTQKEIIKWFKVKGFKLEKINSYNDYFIMVNDELCIFVRKNETNLSGKTYNVKLKNSEILDGKALEMKVSVWYTMEKMESEEKN